METWDCRKNLLARSKKFDNVMLQAGKLFVFNAAEVFTF